MPEPTKAQKRTLETLAQTGGNQAEAARRLGVASSTVRTHVCDMRRMGVDVPVGHRVTGLSTLYQFEGADGEPVLQWVKTTADKQRTQDVYREVIDSLRGSIPRAKPVAHPSRKTSADLLNCYVVTDYHLGMKAWHEETRGADWDTAIAERLLVDWFAHAIKAAPNADRATLAQLGDFLHWDGMDAVTPASGHLLDADTRFQKVVRVAIRALRQVVRILLDKHQSVHLIMAEGNHDPASSVWLRELFSAFYEDEPRVTIDLSPDPYYCVEHGLTSLFFHHGHKKRFATIDDAFVRKFREVFGRTKHSYAHMGHYHHLRSEETNLMVVEQHRTLASPDAYSSRGGWLSGRDAKCITYHKEFGEVGRITISPEMVNA